MYLILAMAFLVVFLSPLALVKKGNGDIFNPLKINAMLHILTVVPYLLIFQFNQEILGEGLLTRFADIDVLFLKYFILQSLSYYFIVGGIFNKQSIQFAKKIPSFNYEISPNRYTLTVIISFTIGLASYFYLMSQIGGMSFFLDNIQARASLTQGLGYHSLLIQFMTFGALLLLYTFRFKVGFFKVLIVFILLSLTIVLESMFGGRKDSVYLIFFAVLIYHYTYKRIKVINWKLVIPISIVTLYFITMPLLRVDGAIEYYSSNPTELISDAFESPVDQINSFSYVRHYLLVIDEFDYNNIWLGRTYLDMLYTPIPRTYFQAKPPIDDGVYLRSIVAGYDVYPNAPYDQLFQSSWPPESFGALYMNFWIPGLLIGMYLLGFIYRTLYEFMVKSKYDFFSTMLYGFMVINFQLSNLRIVQAITFIMILLLFSIIFLQIRKSTKKLASI
ncbi:oligosaccharide repeat unit polymerase [Alkalihalobacillus sp. MEB130]|uniref:O-antigen polymerase n=1 Tax=Alkalihalobacillus sp. MEB130 TaxID=2976704 RepID=UPI0028DD9573|nr:O-antigen polymerase [Alkalihalobacillus sp. MEB130]MDT8860304.1 oligosaccharide repeat unit polymerase [Alkalihalobacillus sp. MEB130]